MLWQESQDIFGGLIDASPVNFRIPASCAETSEVNLNDRIYWHLEAKAELPGVDYVARCEVPVFKTSAI
jgi:hypothetical protein